MSWKSAAFAQECNERFFGTEGRGGRCDENVDPVTEIISVGDSPEEKTATVIVANQLNSVAKTVKFLQQPSPIQILGQLELVHQYLEDVIHSRDPLDIVITPEQCRKSVEQYFQSRPAHVANSFGFQAPRKSRAISFASNYPPMVAADRSPLSHIDLNKPNKVNAHTIPTNNNINAGLTQPLAIPVSQSGKKSGRGTIVTPDKITVVGGLRPEYSLTDAMRRSETV